MLHWKFIFIKTHIFAHFWNYGIPFFLQNGLFLGYPNTKEKSESLKDHWRVSLSVCHVQFTQKPFNLTT